jgi:selenocysteine lyase/cysteine desulfurase
VRGVTTRATRELIATETARYNAFRPAVPPNPNWKSDVRAKVARFIGATAEHVALVRNTTEGVTTVLANWPLSRGDEILTSSAEHGPFYDTLACRAARDGLTVRRFHYPAPAPSLDAIIEAIDRAMTPRTRLVMIGQVVLTGQITPVRAVADLVHAKGAKLLVDGVLAVGHIATDVTAMDCDFYAAGFHKWGCGPRATAVFYVRPGLVEQLPPLFGAYGEDERGLPQLRWNASTMSKYESFGAHPDPHFFALGGAIDFLSSIGLARIRARLFALTSRWMTRAQRLARFRAPVPVNPAHVAGLVAWELDGIDRAKVREALTGRKLLVGGTESYRGFFGIPEDRPRSLFVANAGLFTAPADVDRLADAIEEAAR